MNVRKWLLVTALVAILFQIGAPLRSFAAEVPKTVQTSDPVAVQPPVGKLPTALLSLTSSTGAFSQYAFLVDKKARTLTVWQTSEGDALKLIGAWPTDIGKTEGDKLVQGDSRTPEGIYFFQTSMDGRQLNFENYGVHIFTLDYPNYYDRLEKKSGNGIWFHAIPDTKSLLRGSKGCVVVRNKVIEEVSKYVELKRTPMLIVGEVEYVDPPRWQELRQERNAWLESWRKTWMGKDLDVYMSQYSERFKSMGMNKERWRSYKKNLADRYQFIDVALQDVQIFMQGPKVVFRFLQNYKSDQKADFGTKMIYALKEGDAYRIVGETWEAYLDSFKSQPAAEKLAR
jgi:murein L,D-transpeptidase YafK